jgi:hypothetical protein
MSTIARPVGLEGSTHQRPNGVETKRAMTKPIPDKAEVALEYPDKLYIGTFERTARFDAHLDGAGISLSLHRTGDPELRKSVRMHFHYAFFAEILRDLAKTVASLPPNDPEHRDMLRDGAKALFLALECAPKGRHEKAPRRAPGASTRTPPRMRLADLI